MTNWKPISSVPKDGTIIKLYRKPKEYYTRDTIVFAVWSDDEKGFIWPTEPFNPYSKSEFFGLIEEDFWRTVDFVCWDYLDEKPTDALLAQLEESGDE